MKWLASRILAPAALLALVWALLAAAKASSHDPLLQPDKFIIISTTDVKGKTSPCG